MADLSQATDYTVVLRGQEITDWASDTENIVFPTGVESLNTYVGPDGNVLRTRTGEKGGVMEFHLMPASNDFNWMMNLMAQHVGGEVVPFDNDTITIRIVDDDDVTGEAVITMLNGRFSENVYGITAGKGEVASGVFRINYAEIKPNFTNAPIKRGA